MLRNRKALAAIALFLGLFILLSLPVPVSRGVRNWLANLTVPAVRFFNAVGHKVGTIWAAAFRESNLVSRAEKAETRARRLEAETAILEERLRAAQRVEEQGAELKGSGLRLVPAHVIGRDPAAWFRTVLIDQGKRDGVAVGAAVVVGDHLVGRVIDIGGSWSRVRLVLDPRSVVPALVRTSRTPGLVSGSAAGQLRMDFIEAGAPIEKGDVVITSSLGSTSADAARSTDTATVNDVVTTFPQGFTIGTVTRVREEEAGRLSADLEAAVDFSRLEIVLVVVE